MSRVTIQYNHLVITMQGARKLFAVKNEVSVPLDGIEEVRICLAEEREGVFFKGWRVPGTDVGFYAGGTFYRDGNKAFYDLLKKEDAVIITLKEEEDFKHLIIGVENPNATVETIKKALSEIKA